MSIAQSRHPHRRPPVAVMTLIAAALLASACAPTEDGVGLHLTKPAGWTYVSSTEVAAHGDAIGFSAGQLDAALAHQRTAPLLALVKYPPPHADVNPTFGVNITRADSLRGHDAGELLAVHITEAQTAADGKFEVIEPNTALTVAGRPAARAVLRGPGDAAPIITIVVVVVDRTKFMFVTSGNGDGVDAADHEFAQILASLALPGAHP